MGARASADRALVVFQTAGKIIRHGRQVVLKISAAMLDVFARSANVARASCWKEEPS
jgi:hypothetical protein